MVSPAERRKEWSRPYIRTAPESPAYGTPEWLALPEGPEKIAAVVRAAECWATDGDELEERLRLQLETSRLAHKQAEDAEYLARRDAWHTEWGNRSFRPHPSNRAQQPVTCVHCGTPTSPWSCSCGQTRVGEVA